MGSGDIPQFEAIQDENFDGDAETVGRSDLDPLDAPGDQSVTGAAEEPAFLLRSPAQNLMGHC